ncbi:hypothetical protein WR25_14489 isoform A [Diploscapter pachys]|uniref:Uncharacterized protein n=1 Tax=Diploscapter pachys TaxID=2018661 RepID=A0A2A2J2B5_9BILA|nr:hypothetical protein WR25_14489 isoform A [Diploscapter pachys]
MAEKHTAVKVEDEIEPNTPPPYMDPANAQYKKKMSRIHKQSITVDSHSKRCEHCGAYPQLQQPQQVHMIWPPPRPADHIHQDSTKFIGYILLIAVVVFLVFAACKYIS